MKDLTDNMEFTEIKDLGNYTVYGYQVKDKNNSGYLSKSQVKILIKRIGKTASNVLSICGYNVVQKNEDLAETIRNLSANKSLSENSISVPNDMLPKDPEELRNEMLNNVIIDAKENGIKKRYLIRI